MTGTTEAEEMHELMEMLGGDSCGRTSDVTASRYNRWLLAETNREIGHKLKMEKESNLQNRREIQEQHKKYGNQLYKQSREQMNRDKQIVEMTKQQNLAKGQMVKADVIAQKAQAEKQKQEWQAHGRALANRDQMQKKKIREVVGENSKRVAQMTAKAKQEEMDYERELAEVRDKLLADNKAEVAKVREETADEVIDAAKEFAFEQRKSLAFATKADTAAWKAEADQHRKAHIEKAQANREAARASRERAKLLREEISKSRREIATAARKQQQSNKDQKEKMQYFGAAGVKDTHDSVYKKKFVPAEAAKAMKESKYSSSIA